MQDNEKLHLRRLPLFREMMTPTFNQLMEVAYSQAFPPQLELLHQGQHADFLHIVVEGAVELYASWQGRSSVMGIVLPVSSFILAACVHDAPVLMSARTITRSRIILIPAADVRVALRQDSDFAMAVIGRLADGYREFVRHSKNLKLRSSLERLAAYILHQSKLRGDADSFTLPVEKRHLASYLNMTPENLSRAMKILQDTGIAVQGREITITDRARLKSVVTHDPLIDGPLNNETGLPPPLLTL